MQVVLEPGQLRKSMQQDLIKKGAKKKQKDWEALACRLMTVLMGQATAAPRDRGGPQPMAPPAAPGAAEPAWVLNSRVFHSRVSRVKGSACSFSPPRALCRGSKPCSEAAPHTPLQKI